MKTSNQKGLTGVNKRCMEEAVARELIVAVKSQHDDIKINTVKMIDGRAWLALGYNSFKAMCDEEISHYSYSYLSKIRQAYKTHVEIESKEDFAKVPEHYYRELRKAQKDHRATVWNEAIQAAGGLDALTLQHISDAAKPYLPEPKEPKPAHEKAASIDRSALTEAENQQLDDYLEKQKFQYEALNNEEALLAITRALVPSMKGNITPLQKQATTVGKTLRNHMANRDVTSEAAKELCIRRVMDLVEKNVRKGVAAT